MQTWWQRNVVQGRAEVVLAWVLFALVVVTLVFWVTAGWAQESVTLEIKPCSDTWIACRYEFYYGPHHTAEVNGVPIKPHTLYGDFNGQQLKTHEQSGVIEVWAYPLGNGKMIRLSEACSIGDAALTQHDRLIHCHGKDGWRETAMMQTACEQQMEAAMRAMDEFTLFNNLSIVDAVHRSPQAELQREIERLNRRDAAKAQWDRVKHECWRKP